MSSSLLHEIIQNKYTVWLSSSGGVVMSVYDGVLKEHGGTEAVGGEKLGIFLSFGGTLSKSPIVTRLLK
jgi:hypothetical protein